MEEARDRRLCGALLLRAGPGGRTRTKVGCPATPGATRTRRCASDLDELGRRLGGAYRVLVDDNDHVDREAAVRAGVAFYGKNTMAITRRFGSWVVLGTLVTDVEIEPTPPLELDCGSCRLCIDACPTGALDEPGVLDATKCLSYWTQAPAPIPEQLPVRAGRQRLRLRHLPGRVPVEPGDREAASPSRRLRLGIDTDRLAAGLARRRRGRVRRGVRSPLRSAQRSPLASAKCAHSRGERRELASSCPRSSGTRGATTPCSRDAAEWALERIAERPA